MRISLQHGDLLIQNLEVTVISQSAGMFTLLPVRTEKNPAFISVAGGNAFQILPPDVEPVPVIVATQGVGPGTYVTDAAQTGGNYSFAVVQPPGQYYFYPGTFPVLVVDMSFANYTGITCRKVGLSFARRGVNVTDLGFVRLENTAPFTLVGGVYPVLLPSSTGVAVKCQINDADGIQANPRGDGSPPPSQTILSLTNNGPCDISVEPVVNSAPNAKLVSTLTGVTDKNRAHLVSDANLLDKAGENPQIFAVRKIVMDRTGLTACFESDQLFAAGGDITKVLDHQHSLCRISGDANELLRPYLGQVLFGTGPSPSGARRRRRRTDLPSALATGDAIFNFQGEFYHIGMRDHTNGPLRAYSDTVILAYPLERPSLYAGTNDGMLYSAHLPSADQGKSNGTISVGDLQLELIDGMSITLRGVGFADPGQPEFGRGLWTFDVAKAVKTPFKGDAGDAQADYGSPFLEYYMPGPAAAKSVRLKFDSIGVAYASDILSNFAVIDTGFTTKNAQPQNSTFTFRPGTTISRSLQTLQVKELLELAQNPLQSNSKADTVYTSINADITLDVGTPASPSQSASTQPLLTWTAEFEGGLANNNLAALWTATGDPGSNLSDYLIKQFASGSNRLPLAAGWETAPLDNRYINYEDQLIKLDLRKRNGQPESGDPASISVNFKANNGPAVSFTILDLNGKPIVTQAVPEEWSRIFDKAFLHPGCPNWCGILAYGTSVTAPLGGLPADMAKLIQQVPVTIAWFDGLGTTAVASLEANLDDPNAAVICLDPNPQDPSKPYRTYTAENVKNVLNAGPNPDNPSRILLALINFYLVVRHGHIEKLHFEFWWQMPFFDRTRSDEPTSPRQFVKVTGDWRAPEGSTEKQLVMSASLSNMTMKVGWMGIDTVQIDSIQFVCSNPSDSNPNWQIKIDGVINLDAQAIALFGNTIESLEFKGLTFDFHDPLGMFKGFVFRLNKQLDIQFQRFNFKLLNFSIPDLSDLRTLKLNGDLSVALPLVSSFISPTINLNIVFSMPMDSSWIPSFKFEDFNLDDLSINIFNFATLKGGAKWDDAKRRFAGSITVLWNSSGSTSPVAGVQFIMKSSGTTYWVAGLTIGDNAQLNLGFMTAQNMALIVAHRATHAGIRDAVLSVDLDAFKTAITEDTGSGTIPWLDQWEYDPHSTWLIGLYIGDLAICGDIFKGQDCSLFLTDGGVFRLGGNLTLCGIDFAKAMVAIDWITRSYAGSIALPNFDCGSYQLDLGTLGLQIGNGFEADLGYPFNLDWSRSIKVHWTPTPWPIPINTVQGGMLFSVTRGTTGLTVTTGLAVRAGYSTMIGSDGGAFGAFVSGSLLLGSVVTGTVGVGTMLLSGQVTLDINACGGVVVFGLRWDIITLFAHTDVGYTVGIYDGQMVAMFNADFSAGFTVCLTPCTCLSGQVSFGYSLNAASSNSYKVPSPSGALDFSSASRVVTSDEAELAQIIAELLGSHSKE